MITSPQIPDVELDPNKVKSKQESVSFFTPREIVSELDRYIIGQDKAKRSVAIALRNRWRRQQLDEAMREEVLPKNILMIGPTGVGKTEIARRLAKLAQAPFIKVEATKFTEVGYVGRDVESIVRDLLSIAINQTRERHRSAVQAKAETAAEERILQALVGKEAKETTKDAFRGKLRKGDLDFKEIEIEVSDQGNGAGNSFEVPGMPGAQMSMINIGDMIQDAIGGEKTKKKTMTVKKALEIVQQEEADKLLDEEQVIGDAINAVEQNAIVFLDEFDKITARSDYKGGNVSREGVQRDLLPLIEGTTVMTKQGPVKTDHILFIASGAFHVAKPSDLLPEIQGRLPNRVELDPLTESDFKKILTETEASLIKQYTALMKTEEVILEFTDGAIDTIARLTAEINSNVENIGARRLQTVLEKLLEEISFTATDRGGDKVTVDSEMVEKRVGDLAKDKDLSKFIL